MLHVDYLKSTSDQIYKNYEAVVNLVMKKYKYGGYVLGEAGQTFVKPVSGDYNVAVKVNTGSMADRAYAQAMDKEADALVAQYRPMAQEIYDTVMGRFA